MSGLKLRLKGQNASKKDNTRPMGQGDEFNKEIDEAFEVFESQENSSKNEDEGVLHFKNEDSNSSGESSNQEGQAKVNLKLGKGPKRENKRKKTNKYFYKVSNHHELFKIGRSFYTDYMAGVKSFAITSTGYQTSQQKTILGLASFFDHKEDLKIGVVSDNLFQGAFKDIVTLSKKVNYDYFGDDHTIQIYSFYNHFEFIDMNQLLELSNDAEVGDYDEVLDHFVDLYDIVFWDVPELHKIQIDSERYFPVIMKFESISIIVAQSLSKKGDIEDIKKFFLGYGINLKGLLLEEKSSLEKPKEEPISKDKVENNDEPKKPWWRKFF